MKPITESEALFKSARQLMPGGVSSPVRAFKAVGGTPRFICRAAGAWLEDVDGNRYVDYVLSYGPLILGHAHPAIVNALTGTIRRGTAYGTPTRREITLVRLITTLLPGMDMVRLVNSGTEAVMSALRLARAWTGRDRIIKCTGNYHGHADSLLVQAGSGVATLGLPDSPGVPESTVKNTLVVPYNDLAAAEAAFGAHRKRIAAMIVEPVAGNMGVVLPQKGYLQGLRDITRAHDALLIFDEVMTGFRVHPSGAQGLYQVTPDLTTLGKVIGGGLPIGAYGGRRDIMALVAPSGPMYQAGTLSGNPLAVEAGIVTLEKLQEPGIWSRIARQTARLARGWKSRAEAYRIPLEVAVAGTMFGCFYTDQPVIDWNTAKRADTTRYAGVFHALLERGVHLAPSQYEACFVSSAHDDEVVSHTLDAVDAALADEAG